jgi:hypothetical protein
MWRFKSEASILINLSVILDCFFAALVMDFSVIERQQVMPNKELTCESTGQKREILTKMPFLIKVRISHAY